MRPKEIAAYVAADLGLPLADLASVEPDRNLIAALDEGLVRNTKALPVERTETGLRVLMVDPSDPAKLSTLRQFFRCDVEVEMVTDEDFAKLVRECFNDRSVNPARIAAQAAETDGSGSFDRPVEQITEAILVDGIRQGATDIHFHPSERVTRLRYRMDGVLRQIEAIPASITQRPHVAPEDHGRARHLRAASAPGRSHPARGGRAARSTCACRPCPAPSGNRWC